MGKLNVDRMLREITAKQFLAWSHYDQLEPFGELRADIRAAQIVSTLINVNRGKNQRAVTIKDVLIDFEGSKPIQSVDEKMRIMALVMKAQALAAAEMNAEREAALAKTTSTDEFVPSEGEARALEAARKAIKGKD